MNLRIVGAVVKRSAGRELNTKVQVSPTNPFAGMFSFIQAEYFEIQPMMRQPINVQID